MKSGRPGMRFDGAIRIGLSGIDAAWRSSQAVTSRRIAASEDQQPRQHNASIESALGGILDAAPRRRRFFSPHLRILIADPYLQMAVIRFQQLPRSRADLELLVTQRFCRDHRLEPSAAAIAFAPQGETQGAQHVMVCALDAALANVIRQCLVARNLYADIIAAESMFTIRALQGLLPDSPSLLLLLHNDYATIVLWQTPDVIGHIGVFRQHDRPRAAFFDVLKARIERYAATIAGPQDSEPTVHILDCGETGAEGVFFNDLPHPVRDLRREPALAAAWPSGPGIWTAIAEQGG